METITITVASTKPLASVDCSWSEVKKTEFCTYLTNPCHHTPYTVCYVQTTIIYIMREQIYAANAAQARKTTIR